MNVTEREEKPVLLLLAYGFFMGIFLAIFKIVATTLFLNDPELVKIMRQALFVSGILGVVSMMLYSFFLKRLNLSTLLTFLVASIFIFIALARYLYSFPEYNFQIKYILFVAVGPITSLMVLGFFGIFYRLFDFGQSKRIISRIDTGQLIAIIMATYAVPLLMGVISDITDFLIIAEVSLIITLLFIFIIISSHNINTATESESKQEGSKIKNLIKEPYVISVVLFIFFSMLASTFLDYSFWNVTEQQYPDEKQLASFLGVFEGTIMVISLLLQTFVNEFLIRNFSLRISILLLPVILLTFTAAALFSGYYFGYTLPNEYFIWFFLFITLSNLFTKILREATENPILKLFLMPLYKKIHLDTQAKIEGIFVEATRAIGGGLILLFGLIPAFKLIHYSWIMVGIVIFWIYIALRTHRQYKKKIEEVLVPEEGETSHLLGKRKILRDKIIQTIQNSFIDTKIFTIRLLAKIDIHEFLIQSGIIRQSAAPDDLFVWKVIENDLPYLLAEGQEGGELPLALPDFKSHGDRKKSLETIKMLKGSSDPGARIKLARMIASSEGEEGINILFDLVNDQNVKVVKTALVAAGRLKRKEYLVFLIENIQNETHRNAAIEAIAYYGYEALSDLDKLFYNSDHDPQLQLIIIQIYGKIGANIATDEFSQDDRLDLLHGYLLTKMSYPNKKIANETLKVMGYLEMTIDEDKNKLSFIIQELDKEIENLFWINMAISQLQEKSQDKYNDIILAMREDIMSGYDHLFLLLSMIFNPSSIQLMRENIESESSENISYAMELIGVLFEEFRLSNELKEKVTAVFEKFSQTGSASGLYKSFYHGKVPPEREIIKQLINRELEYTNRWTKACALYFVGREKRADEFEMELVANLHNPDELLSEVAAYAMYYQDKELLLKNIGPLDENRKKYIKALIIDGEEYKGSNMLVFHMKFDIVKFFKEYTFLTLLPSAHLTHLADVAREEFFDKNTNDINKIVNKDALYFIFEGGITVVADEPLKNKSFLKGDMLKERNCNDLKNNISGVEMPEKTVMLSVDKDKFYDFIVSENKYLSKIINAFKDQDSKTVMEPVSNY